MYRKRNIVWFSLISAAIVVLFCADILLGSQSLTLSQVWLGLTGGAGSLATEDIPTETLHAIVVKFRLPKAVVAVVAGASLSASGLQMQTLFRNPLAGPYVLGISSGASLGVALFLLGMPFLGVTAMGDILRNLGVVGSAWIGAATILALVMAVSARIKDIMAVLILGIMFGSAATALVEILQYLSPESALKSYVIWTMGSLGGVLGSQLGILVAACVIGLLFSIFLIKPLNMLLLGENYARTMGLNVKLTRSVVFLSTTLLAGTVTAFCGPIGFIGIAVPHVARMIFAEADHKILMPASIMLGAAGMLFCDIISQLPGYDMVLPINTITALMGIPVVVMVIVRNRKIF